LRRLRFKKSDIVKAFHRIKVIDEIGSPYGISADDGTVVHKCIREAIEGTELPVELDFSGMELVIAAFLNTAIGRLAGEMSLDEIRSRISFTGLAVDDRELVDRVLENAMLFYADPEQFKKSLEFDEDDEEMEA